MVSTTLLLIDAQKDFHPGGSLAIPTANEDAGRIVQLIGKVDRIVATLDSHHKLHLAHPSFWWSADGSKHPDPFTIISAEDLEKGVWKPRADLKIPKGSLDPSIFADNVYDERGTLDLTKYCIAYAKRLEERGRFQICIWPEHCLIGSEGHAVVDPIREAMALWGERTGGSVEWVLKGENLLTEMYSALAAEIPVTKDTSFNEDLLESLLASDKILVCGQAMSHCVNYTLRDLVERWPKERASEITLVLDGASAVPGFEAAADQFVSDMKAAGVQVRTTAEILK